MKKKNYIVMLFFLLVILLQYSYVDKTMQFIYSNQNTNPPIGEITESTELKVEFYSQYENLSSVGVLFSTLGRQNQGNISVQVLNENNDLLYTEVIDVSKLKDNVYKQIELNKIKKAEQKKYIVVIKGINTKPGKAPGVFLGDTGDFSKTYLNGTLMDNNIKVMSTHNFISKNRIIIFGFVDILALIFILFILKVGKQKTYYYVYKFRYALLMLIFIFGLINKINLSSIDMWDANVNSLKTNPYEETIIFGKSRPIRSDEWLVQTPMYLSQSLNKDKFPVYNSNLSSQGTNMILSSYSPTYDIISIGKPFNWGFLLLGKDYGFSWYWLSKVLLLFIFSFELSMILTKDNKKISFFGALIILFSGSMQWWLSTGVVDLLVFSEIIIVSLSWYLKSSSIFKKFLSSVGIVIGGTGFIFNLYPPLQIPLGILTLVFMFYLFTENNNWKTFNKYDYLLISFVVCTLSFMVFHFYMISREEIKLLSNTVYPGKRVATGGGLSIEGLLYYFLSWKLPFRDITTFSNNSEVSSFFTLFPFIPCIFLLVNTEVIRRIRLLKYLIYFSFFQMVWFFIPFPEWFAKATLMSYVEPSRLTIIFGITCTYILIIYLACIKEIKYKWTPVKIFIILNMFFFIFLYKSNIHVFLKRNMLLATLLYINLIIYCIIKGRQSAAAILISIFVFVSGAIVNPIAKGLAPIHGKEISREIRNIDANNKGKWVGLDNMTFGNYLAANGVNAFNCVNFYPDFIKWNKIDPTAKFADIYNRYAHIGVNLTYEKTEFVLNAPDFFTVTLSYADLIKNTDINYIISKSIVDPENRYKVFKELYYDSKADIYIYEIKR